MEQQIPTGSMWKTPAGTDGYLKEVMVLAEPVAPWRKGPLLEKVYQQDLGSHGGSMPAEPVPGGICPMEGTHTSKGAGDVREEFFLWGA